MSNPNDFVEMKSNSGATTSHGNTDGVHVSVSPVDPSPASSYAVISPPSATAASAPPAALSFPPPPQPPPQLPFTPSHTSLLRPTPSLMYGDHARNERRISGLEKELAEQKSTMSRVEDLLVRMSSRLDSNVTGNISIDTTQVPPSPAVPTSTDSSHMNLSAGRTPYVRDSLPAVHENDMSHLYDGGHIPSSASDVSYGSRQSTGSSLRGVKVEAPPTFDGKPGSTAVSLTTWINQMEIWLEVIDADVNGHEESSCGSHSFVWYGIELVHQCQAS